MCLSQNLRSGRAIAVLIVLLACVFEGELLNAATAFSGDPIDSFTECCERRTVTDERGSWQEEIWRCVQKPQHEVCPCKVECDCGVVWNCAYHDVTWNACSITDDYSGAPFQHCAGLANQDYYQPTPGVPMNFDVCNSLSMACYEPGCGAINKEQECAIRCGGN